MLRLLRSLLEGCLFVDLLKVELLDLLGGVLEEVGVSRIEMFTITDSCISLIIVRLTRTSLKSLIGILYYRCIVVVARFENSCVSSTQKVMVSLLVTSGCIHLCIDVHHCVIVIALCIDQEVRACIQTVLVEVTCLAHTILVTILMRETTLILMGKLLLVEVISSSCVITPLIYLINNITIMRRHRSMKIEDFTWRVCLESCLVEWCFRIMIILQESK
jgi:hypothetical protein